MRLSRETKSYLAFGAFLFVVLEVLLVVAIVWWPSFEKNIGPLKSLASPLPMLANQISLIEMIGVPGYVVAQQFFKACNTLGSAAAVLFAMGAIAGEVHRGTLEVWLARPVTRTRLYAERYFWGMAAIWIPVFASSLTAPGLLTIVDETMGYWELTLCSFHQSLFLGAIYSFTFLLSSFSSQPLKIAFVMLFFSIFQFAIYMVKTVTDYSLFRLADIETYAAILSSKSLDVPVVLSLFAANALCFFAGLAIFQRRVP